MPKLANTRHTIVFHIEVLPPAPLDPVQLSTAYFGLLFAVAERNLSIAAHTPSVCCILRELTIVAISTKKNNGNRSKVNSLALSSISQISQFEN